MKYINILCNCLYMIMRLLQNVEFLPSKLKSHLNVFMKKVYNGIYCLTVILGITTLVSFHLCQFIAVHWLDHYHDDVIKHFPRYWPFVRGIHQSPVNSPPKGQWRGALMFSLICAWMNVWVNNHDLRRHRAHYDVKEMRIFSIFICWS